VIREPRDSVLATGSGPLGARVGHALASRGIEPEDLRTERAGLPDAYLAVTGQALDSVAGMPRAV